LLTLAQGLDRILANTNLLLAGAVAVAATGAIWDIRTYRIPNVLTYSAMMLGIAIHIFVEGRIGIVKGLLGLLVGGGIFFFLYVLRTMGAGDVKLMAAVGAFAGPSAVAAIALYSAIAGGVMALFVAVWKRRLRHTLGSVVDVVRFHATVGAEMHPTVNLENPEALRFAYGVAILAGTLIQFFAAR
jgi:prepilin peptidase CpaA